MPLSMILSSHFIKCQMSFHLLFGFLQFTVDIKNFVEMFVGLVQLFVVFRVNTFRYAFTLFLDYVNLIFISREDTMTLLMFDLLFQAMLFLKFYNKVLTTITTSFWTKELMFWSLGSFGFKVQYYWDFLEWLVSIFILVI